MTPGALLFDMDGVLVDSLAAVDRSWRWWAARHGLDPGPFLEAHGRPDRESIKQFAPNLDAEAEAELVEARETGDTEGVTALPGAAEMLRSQSALAIVTSATAALAAARLRAAGLPTPDVMITADQVRHGKPDPEPYLRAAAALAIAPRHCTVFEDAPAGVRAARAAGMRVVALTTTVDASQLAGADLVVADLAAYRKLHLGR